MSRSGGRIIHRTAGNYSFCCGCWSSQRYSNNTWNYFLKALEKAKMSVDEIDLIEINEAFAVMPLVSSLSWVKMMPVKLSNKK